MADFQRQEKGGDPKQAAALGAREVATAVVASTLTSVIVFAPVVLSKGTDLNAFLGEVGVTISITLIFSLIICLTLLTLTRSRARNERMLLAYGAGADAQVVQVRRVWYIHFGSKHPYDVYYQFRGPLGREVIGRDRTYHYAWAQELKPGDKIGVVYHPELPEANVLWLHGKEVQSEG